MPQFTRLTTERDKEPVVFLIGCGSTGYSRSVPLVAPEARRG